MSINFTSLRDDLLFVPLGGSNEIGMNLNLYTTQGKWLMVDCGIGFANESLPGVEIIVPDIQFIIERKADLVGLVLTHAHEDHLGAVPYLWRELECPIYATPFTASFLRHKFNEMGPGKKPTIHELKAGDEFKLGPFDMHLVPLTHSIPEMQAVAIRTQAGTVMHTGDWKFDESPQVGPVSHYDALKAYGDKGVLAMVCDSTNVFVEGESGSEAPVRENLTDVIAKCDQRVIVSTFASNVARVESIIVAAQRAGRLVGLMGRSLWRIMDTAQETGYLKNKYEFVSEQEVANIPRKDLVVICTGCQGEPRAALTRMARDDHQHLRLSKGDTVIFSSRKIPGNDIKINHMTNQLVRRGIEVFTERNFHIHVSGHPARDELKRMYDLVRPKISVPTHGEARHLHEQAKLARKWGVKETVEAYNGAVILLKEGEAGIIGHVPSGYLAVDGNALIPTDGNVIRMRRKLRDDGVAMCSFVIDKRGELLGEVQLSTPGLLHEEEDADLLAEIAAEIAEGLEKASPRASDEQRREIARLALRKIFKRELDKKPVIEVHVIKV